MVLTKKTYNNQDQTNPGLVASYLTRLVETHARQHGPCWRVMEIGHPSTRAVNSGSGNRALANVNPHELFNYLNNNKQQI